MRARRSDAVQGSAPGTRGTRDPSATVARGRRCLAHPCLHVARISVLRYAGEPPVGDERRERKVRAMYEAETRGVRVTVTPEYQAVTSRILPTIAGSTLMVEITNLGRHRRWCACAPAIISGIVDGRNIQEVWTGRRREQPILQPGESF